MAGYNINGGLKGKKSSQAEEEDGFSSDPLEGFEQDKSCYQSVRALGNCILGKYEMPEEPELGGPDAQSKKPFGLFG